MHVVQEGMRLGYKTFWCIQRNTSDDALQLRCLLGIVSLLTYNQGSQNLQEGLGGQLFDHECPVSCNHQLQYSASLAHHVQELLVSNISGVPNPINLVASQCPLLPLLPKKRKKAAGDGGLTAKPLSAEVILNNRLVSLDAHVRRFLCHVTPSARF